MTRKMARRRVTASVYAFRHENERPRTIESGSEKA
jgi:hypothetical protein